VKIIWSRTNNKLEVYFDGTLRLTYTNDLINDVFSGNPSVYAGFTAGTGVVFNEQGICDINFTNINDAPVAIDDAYSTNEDTPLTIATPGVLSNDSDINNDALSAVLVNTTTNGSLTLNANGSFSYTPSLNFNGSDSFTYRANDGGLNSNVVTVTLTVNAVNDAPVATNDAYSTNENTPLTLALPGVLGNDSDAEGSTLAAILVTTTSNGTLTLNADGSFSYTPSPNFNGSDSFTYQANDGGLNSNVATVLITVVAVNDAPVAVNDSYSTNEDTPLTLALPGVLGNDSDIDNDALSAVLVTTTSQGSLTLNANGSFSYTPSPNFNGNDSFTYRANDGSLNSNVVTVTLTVNAVNDAPVAVNDSYSTNEDTPLAIILPDVLANDTDAEGSALSAVLVTTTSQGTLALNANGSFSYTPSLNFNGNDSFTYKAFDGQIYSQIATVTITVQPVNDQPVALNDQVLTDENEPTIIDVLRNDSDVDGDVLTTTILSPPTKGTLKKTGNGTYEYTPQFGFSGSDNFSYEVCDNGVPVLCDQATVVLTITQLIDEVVLYEGISPNGDGMNDTWIIENIDDHPRNAVRIFNRWGTLVFEQQDYDNDSKVWKGNTNRGTTVGGDQLPNGTYFYTIEFNDSKTLKKGYVVLNR
jgi:gliding motility-associated-like protein